MNGKWLLATNPTEEPMRVAYAPTCPPHSKLFVLIEPYYPPWGYPFE